MIIAVTLDGWSAFSRQRSRRFSSIVRRALDADGDEFRHLTLLSHFIWSNTRKALRFIRHDRNNQLGNILFLSGKSLGGWNIWERIVPRLHGLKYAKVLAVTVDPCRPIGGDLTPNLNEYKLQVVGCVDQAVNLFAKVDGVGPAGCQVIGEHIQNIELHGVNHEIIVDHPGVVGCVRLMLKEEWPFQS